MRIIDLLNEIANGEEVPKKIKWNYHIYIYDEQYDDYYEETTALFENEMNNGMLLKNLNDEVEIIEEVEKPKKIEPLEFKYTNTFGNVSQHKASERDIIDKINEISKAVNYLLEKSDKE